MLRKEGNAVENSVKAPDGAKRDLTGQRFGRLTVLRQVPVPEGLTQNNYWLCRCDCGTERVVLASNLIRGHTKSCGCLKQRDLTGQRISRLTVLERSDQYATRGKRTVRLWKCQCDCGNITYKATDTLTGSRNCSCAECAGRRNAAKARENAGFVDGTQLCKLPGEEPSMPHDGKCRGVYYDKKRNLYEAVIKFRGKRTRLGHFHRFEDAVKARQAAEQEIFGGFRRQLAAQQAEAEAAKKADSGASAVCLAGE